MKFKKLDDKLIFIEKLVKGKRVLDLGCIDHTIKAIQSKNSVHLKILENAKYVLGVDYLEREVKQLQKRGYNIICQDIENLNLGNIKFDVIILGGTIEHLSNPGLALQSIKRYMKRDSVLIITTPNPFTPDRIFMAWFSNSPYVNSEHTVYYTPFTLNELLRRYKFKIKEIYFYNKSGGLDFSISNRPRLAKLIYYIKNMKLKWYEEFLCICRL